MDTKKEDIWNKCLSLIRDRVGESVFNLWFKPIRLRQLKQDYAQLEIPNRFYKEWIEENYTNIIEDVFYDVIKIRPTLRYTIREKQDEDIKKLNAQINSKRRSLRNRGIYLNPKYTFEEFVVGSSNQFAHAAALKVAESPGTVYNPLFIYGGVGLGKTHLINAIGNRVLENHRNIQVIYVPAEQFTNEVVAAIKNDRMTEFKEKYRNADLLLIDDIQFIANKTQTQEEFFHTFNALYEQQKQIVISSDRPPKDIQDITDRLKSRFTMGLIADIQPPSVETKIAILEKKAEFQRITLPQEVKYWLAQNVRSNIRELEGCLLKIAAHASLTGEPITLEMTKEILKDTIVEKNRPITVDYIMKVVAEEYRVKVNDLKSKKRTKEIAIPRQIAMFLSRELTDLSLQDIGKHFGGKDHATVLYACKQIEKRRERDDSFLHILEALIKKIKGE
ncbi:MAG: chromosomal replication initiator protein DnaA [Nitrospirae bacterium]|nr:MAG: chromosomal replication initiator protein DnaA [Nitrospirota bacterium]